MEIISLATNHLIVKGVRSINPKSQQDYESSDLVSLNLSYPNQFSFLSSVNDSNYKLTLAATSTSG